MRKPRSGHRRKRDFDKVYRDFYRRTVEEPRIIAETEARLVHKPTLRSPPGTPRMLVALTAGVPDWLEGNPLPSLLMGQVYVEPVSGQLYRSDGRAWLKL